MSLLVYSARVDYGGPDRLDVTARGATDAAFLAPPLAILRPALEVRKTVKELRAEGHVQAAEALETALWDRYATEYRAAMRWSYRHNRAQWDALMGRERVVLVCYCTDPERCHRGILRTEILPKCGAINCGEIQMGLFGGRNACDTGKGDQQ